ncbi:MipA/OmpV family protein [Ralstonia pseudosolanacearum]|uniref:Probable outer membrane v-related protein transmembrane n=3 Tax=Ralstonia solanacearum species complex TaxID=3116862 RepID=Q8XX34_RALN1|nr:MipA/OmpV family protein [Ralstonia pseudosolanacearum]AZU55388.1 MipA/OmpV family protein [Ralstonia solanacearum]RAA09817.1 MipA/OmpV family protein [Ralstonia pseudosolanacearum]CAD15991.1 probable outer membrane v-related protein transmembrane [Ralstonia pseudosolanacearum GMI1000]CUV45958.1 putative outer membrane v-related protein transmembrane [Ralstonia solanacearum]
MRPDAADTMPVPTSSILRALPLVCLLACGLTAGPAAHANTGNDDTASDWSIAIGPSVYVTPKYPGARSSFVFPWVDQEIEYRHRFFSKGTDFLGAYLVNDDTWQVGGNFQLDPTWRHASDDARLAGLGNVNATVRAKVFAQYTVSFLTLSTDAEQDILGNRQGLIVNGDVYASAPVGRWLFSLGAGLSWVNRQYMGTFFGVDADQSARSGLPAFAARAGVRDRHLNAIVTCKLDDRWTASGSVTLARLRGDAADSPITQRRQQTTAMASVTYRFR